MTLELITLEALKLNRLDRIRLIQLVLDSITKEEIRGTSTTENPSELTIAQSEEIDRRMKLFEMGKMETTPVHAVNTKLIEKYGLQA